MYNTIIYIYIYTYIHTYIYYFKSPKLYTTLLYATKFTDGIGTPDPNPEHLEIVCF